MYSKSTFSNQRHYVMVHTFPPNQFPWYRLFRKWQQLSDEVEVMYWTSMNLNLVKSISYRIMLTTVNAFMHSFQRQDKSICQYYNQWHSRVVYSVSHIFMLIQYFMSHHILLWNTTKRGKRKQPLTPNFILYTHRGL